MILSLTNNTIFQMNFMVLTRTKTYANLYSKLLNDISENFKQARIYAQYEIED